MSIFRNAVIAILVAVSVGMAQTGIDQTPHPSNYVYTSAGWVAPTSVGSATAFLFGATSQTLSSTAPTSGQVLTWNGTNIVGSTVTGTGTVTNFSIGNLSPLFTASASTTTTTTAVSFTLGTAGAHQYLGNNTGSTAVPAYVQPAFGDLTGSATTGQLPFTYTGTTTLLPTFNGAVTASRCIRTDGSGNLEIAAADCNTSTGSPGGANTAVQFNNSSAFGGDATNFFYNSSTHGLTVSGFLASEQIGHTYYAEDFSGATASAQIQACLNALTSNDTCVAKGLTGTALAAITVPSNTHLVLNGNSLAFSGTGFSIASSNVEIDGDNTEQITSAVNSGLIITSGSHIRIKDLVINGYNSSNGNGNAGFFVYGAISDVTFEHDTAENGNGQGFRMDSPTSTLPSNITVDHCTVTSTNGSSSEGIGPGGSNIWITNNYVYKVDSSGILVYNGHSGVTYKNIFILNNSIGDSAFVTAGNPAIQLNPTSNAIANVVVANNNVWDDQSTPTTEVALFINNGSSTGTINALTVTGNTQTNTINPQPISNSMPSGDLTDFQAWILAAGAPSGGCVTGTMYTRTDGGSGSTLYICSSSAWSVVGSGGGGTTNTIASGTAALGTSAIASGACATAVSVSATGVATTDTVTTSFNGDPTAVTGYGASSSGAVLTIYPYPGSNTVNFKVCNSTASSITPSALTLNWRVVR